MPPPKKPKTGPISIEQFLSKEEMKSIDTDQSVPTKTTGTTSPRLQKDMDVEIEVQSPDMIKEEKKNPSTLKILHELFQKPKEDSNNQMLENGTVSPQSRSPSVYSEGGSDPEVKNHFVLPSLNNPPSMSPLAGQPVTTNGYNRSFQNAMSMSLQNGEKILNNLITSSYINNAAHAHPISNFPAYLPSYFYRHSMSGSPVIFNNLSNSNEPHDLSTKVQNTGQDNGIKHKPYENTYSNSNASHHSSRHFYLPYYANGQHFSEAPSEEYLETHKNIVNLLRERRNNSTPTTPSSVSSVEKERAAIYENTHHQVYDK